MEKLRTSDARSCTILDQAIVAQIFLKVRELYKKDAAQFPIRF